MVDRHPAFVHHFLELPVTQRIGGVPENSDQNHIDRKPHPLRIKHGHWLVFKSGSLAHDDNQPA
jgi:hypothetical protein